MKDPSDGLHLYPESAASHGWEQAHAYALDLLRQTDIVFVLFTVRSDRESGGKETFIIGHHPDYRPVVLLDALKDTVSNSIESFATITDALANHSKEG